METLSITLSEDSWKGKSVIEFLTRKHGEANNLLKIYVLSKKCKTISLLINNTCMFIVKENNRHIILKLFNTNKLQEATKRYSRNR